MSETILKALVPLADGFNAHDLDRIMSHFAEDAVLEMPRGPEPWGARFVRKAAIREGLAGRFKGLPDVHYGDAVHSVAGDVASRGGRFRGRRRPAPGSARMAATSTPSATA